MKNNLGKSVDIENAESYNVSYINRCGKSMVSPGNDILSFGVCVICLYLYHSTSTSIFIS
jgi:hypothetical protein